MRVIGFAGLGQAGKTTAVDEICKWCFERGGKMDPKRLHFAGPIKDALECMGAVKFSARDELYRKGAQLIGTKFRDPEFVTVRRFDWRIVYSIGNWNDNSKASGRIRISPGFPAERRSVHSQHGS